MFNKCKRIIESCETTKQVNVSRNYILLAYKRKLLSSIDYDELVMLNIDKQFEIGGF